MYRIAMIIAVLAAQPASAATKLQCASAREIATEAHVELDHAGTYLVNVIFVGKAPAAREIDSVLRDCLAAAVRRDGSKDILASPWLRKKAGGRHSDDELLHPYDGQRYLAYEARSRTIAVRESKGR